MKTIETQKQAFELLNKVKINLEKKCENQPNEPILLKEIRSFLLKDDSQSDIDRDCRNYLEDRKNDLKIHIISDFNIEKKSTNELPDFKFTPPTPEMKLETHVDDKEECPMSNLKERMKSTYPEIFKTLDFNFLKMDDDILSIYEEFSNAFKKYNILIFLSKDESQDTYKPYINHNGQKHIVDGSFEFEQTAQMASIEKCFEIINWLFNTSIHTTEEKKLYSRNPMDMANERLEKERGKNIELWLDGEQTEYWKEIYCMGVEDERKSN